MSPFNPIKSHFFLFCAVAFLFLAPSAHAAYLASDLLGQLDANDNPVFTTANANNGVGSTNSKGISFPRGIVLDSVRHRLFVSDRGNVRVLVFNLDNNDNLIDRTADYVLGATTLTSAVSATTQSNFLSVVQGLSYDPIHDRLFVTDQSAHRIMVFDTSVITNGMNASYVLGQPNFTSSTASTTQSGMSSPTTVAYDQNNDRLFVCDNANNRVLVYDVSSITNGEDAIYVLGQPTFTTSTVSTTQGGMRGPNTGLIYDTVNNRLFVSDTNNRRVLVFDVTSSTMANGMNASYVLGQSTFNTSSSAVTQNGFTLPTGLAYDSTNGRLFVMDQSAHRMLAYDVAPTSIANGSNALAVFGQVNFTSSTVATTQSGFNAPLSAFYDSINNRLYTSDNSNHRVLIFNFARLSTSSLASVNAFASYATTLSSSQSQGTVSYAITSGALPDGLTFTTSTGAITGTPTTVDTYTFSIQATDNNGAIGSFVSQPQSYSITVGPAATVTVGNNNYAPASQVPLITSPITQPTPTTYLPSASIILETPTASNQTPAPAQVSVSSAPTFTQNLKVADKKSEVQSLQQYLNTQGFPVSLSGPGSLGNETNFFGSLTKQALTKFQEAHRAEILTPAGLTKGTGYFGTLTRAYVNTHK